LSREAAMTRVARGAAAAGTFSANDGTVAAGGHSMPLHATYHAIVDGTNGNTLLEQVDASFLNTALTAKGGVLKAPGIKERGFHSDRGHGDA
jgi:hypothetical protein